MVKVEIIKVFGWLADITSDDCRACGSGNLHRGIDFQLIENTGKANVMHTQMDRLITLLDQETECYQELLACVQTEKQAIVDMDFTGLAAIGSQKESTLVNLRQLSAKRTRAVRAICEKMALSAQNLTLGQLSQQVPLPYSQELQRCRKQLRNVLQSLGDENNSVKQLVHHGMALVRGSYQMITQLLDANPVYRASGNLQPAAATGRIHNSDY